MSKFFTDTIYVKLKKSLDEKNTAKEFSTIVERYIESNSNALSTIGPINKTIFSEAERQKVFKCLGIDSSEISKILKSSSYVNSKWKIMAKPFNITMACIIRYYSIAKNDAMVFKSVMYYMFSIYPSYFYKYFKYGANEAIMEYTINDMSNKFKIKTDGNLLTTLSNTAHSAYSNYKSALEKGEDKAYVDLIMGINTRINSLLKNIAAVYYDNHKKQNFLNSEVDNFDEENYSESESNVYKIETITNGIISNIINYGYNYKYIEVAAKMNKVSKNELKNYVNLIITKDINNVKVVVSGIIYSYLIDGKKNVKQINSSDFILYCMEVYKKSNTSDDNINKIKAVLDQWLTEAELYKKTQNVGTINNFRRALFMFFVLTIQGQKI